ncbi:MAG: RHS domain-containing protein [Gammaproteobacteria bacterium]|nr:RHS domain-containing protein [Gammaproteobacteria bacterium]
MQFTHSVKFGRLIINVSQSSLSGLTTLFNYDALDRVDTASGSFGARDYNFDKNGNRRSDVVASTTTTYDYQLATNVMSVINGAIVSVDANGNSTSLRGMTLGYGTLNRLLGVNDATYAYNALNQRVMKTVNGVSTNYTYGLNGELLSEAANDANGVTEYVYLHGAPLAEIRQGNVYYIHTDHLGTPRTLTDATQKVVWRWDSDPFGVGAANDDPDGDGVKVTMNLRFAGQYFDQESGLHYNYHRYYDPQTGRYVTSDPIGLGGGLNTYGYVGGNPIGATDPYGLATSCDVSPACIEAMMVIAQQTARGAASGAVGGYVVGAGINAAGQYLSKGCVNWGEVNDAGLHGAGWGALFGGGIGAASGWLGARAVAAEGLAGVPGRVQSRINVSNEGWAHVLKRHFSGQPNASQFSVSQSELKSLLQSKQVVGTPVSRTVESADGLRYVREIDMGRTIGIDAMNGNATTSIMTTMSDKYGNLITVFPGVLK